MYSASPAIMQVAADAEAARSRIEAHITRTPCLASRQDNGLWFKCENFQQTGSFKLRGAMSKLTMLDTATEVITASSGNHGIACSHAARTSGHRLTVVLPEGVDAEKLKKIKSFGTRVVLHPGDSGKAEKHARQLAADTGCVYVSPYNDAVVMAGQGSIGLELLEQMPVIDNLFVSLGGGGLVSGVSSVIKSVSPDTRIIGVSAMHSAALEASIRVGRVIETEHRDTLADGCAGGIDENALTLPIASEVIDEFVHCSEDAIAEALYQLAWQEKMLVEGAAALAYAGYLAASEQYADQTNVVLLCGSNFDMGVVQPIIARNTVD
mgnify:CR=1 FL=1